MSSSSCDAVVAPLAAAEVERHLPELAGLLHACVQAGASVNFVAPFTTADSAAFWRARVLPSVREGRRHVLVARVGERIVGSVQLGTDTPPNQPHRAEVAKLLVDPAFRRRGTARALMVELERLAHRLGRTLLTLDTTTGGPAQALYASLGYVAVGVIPAYSRAVFEERLEPTTVMYKAL